MEVTVSFPIGCSLLKMHRTLLPTDNLLRDFGIFSFVIESRINDVVPPLTAVLQTFIEK